MGLRKIFEQKAQKKLNKQCQSSAHFGDFKTMAALLDQGADVNSAADVTETFFAIPIRRPTSLGHAAIQHANFKALTVLLDKGLDVNIESSDGKPLLMYAIECGQTDAALALLERGAKTDYVRSDLETPLSLARAKGMAEVAGKIAAQFLPPELPFKGVPRRLSL